MKLNKQIVTLTIAAVVALSIGYVSSARAGSLMANPLLRLSLTGSQRARLQALGTYPRNTYATRIRSVSCARHDDCEAVGFTIGILLRSRTPKTQLTSFAEHWNGTKWSAQKVINPTRNTELVSVSCYAPNSCIAAGGYSYDAGGTGRVVPLTERWNGARWTQIAIGAPKLKHSVTFLSSVSCEFDGSCTATGVFARNVNSPTRGYATQFDGSHWSRIVAPRSGNGEVLSCPAAGDCFALSTFDSTVVHLQSGRWTVQKLQLPKHFDASNSDLDFNSLSCASAADCVATGSYTRFVKRDRYWTVTFVPLVEHYNGTGWHRMLLPRKLYNANAWAAGVVSCSSPGRCVAGGFGLDGGSSATLVLSNGVWHLATATKFGETSISCPDYNYCVAMTEGFYTTSRAGATDPRIVSIFNGKRWRLVRLPLPAFKIIA